MLKKTLRLDLATGVLGRGLAGALMFIFTPIYIKVLGVESYGVLAFYATLLASCLFLDQSISPIITRRFAQTRGGNGMLSELWNTFRTMEIISITIGITLALVIVVAAPWLSESVLKASALDPQRLLFIVELIALLLMVQWPSFYYCAALSGLGDLTAINGIRAAIAVIQWGGGAVVLLKISPQIEVLFLWQGACSILQTYILRWRLSHLLQPTNRLLCWDASLLSEGRKYALGTLVIGFTGTLLTQADKLLVSSLMPISNFSAYSLTFTVVSLVSVFISQPVMVIAFPHFSRLATTRLTDHLEREYRRWTQMMVFVAVPFVGVLLFYNQILLSIWLGPSNSIRHEIAQYIPIVALGTMFNVFMMLPFTLQLACGWSGLSAIKNIVILPFFLLALWYGIPKWGAIVGAWAWFAINATYYFVEVPIMHRRLLPKVLWKWWILDTAFPCLTGLLLFYICRTGFDHFDLLTPIFSCLASIVLVGFYLLLIMPAPRSIFAGLVNLIKPD